MKSRISQKTSVKTRVHLNLKLKVAIGIGLLTIIAGVAVLILLNTGTSEQSKAEAKNIVEPTSNNAYFDASQNSYIDFGPGKAIPCLTSLPEANQLSITLWVKWENVNGAGVGSWANLFSLSDSVGNGDNGVFWIQHNQLNEKFEFALKTTNGRNFIQSTTKPLNGNWYHVACVYDGRPNVKKMHLYVNGILESTLKNVSGNIAAISNTARLNMGRWCNPQGSYRHFNGFLDDVSLWKIALTQTQITELATDPSNVLGSSYDASGLIGYWNFDDLTADNLTGCSINGSIGAAVVLPVELLSFSAEKDNKTVVLKWNTASEINNDFFSVEKSTDLQSFVSIGTVKGAGNSNEVINYSFTDENPGTQLCYYRLKQTDYDGASEYSKVISVNSSKGGSSLGTITAGPNPFTDHVNLNYDAKNSGDVEILLFDMSGKILRNEASTVSEGMNSLSLESLSDLPSGYYLAGIRQNNEVSSLIKLSKVR